MFGVQANSPRRGAPRATEINWDAIADYVENIFFRELDKKIIHHFGSHSENSAIKSHLC